MASGPEGSVGRGVGGEKGDTQGGSEGGIKLGGLKGPYCRFYYTGAYFLYSTYLQLTI